MVSWEQGHWSLGAAEAAHAWLPPRPAHLPQQTEPVDVGGVVTSPQPCGAGGAGSAMRVQGAPRLGAQLSLGERPPGARSRGGAPRFTEEDTACKGFATLVSLQRTGSGPAENPRLQGGLQSLGDVQVTPAQLGPVRTPTAFFAQAARNTRCWICRCHTLGLPVPVGWVLVEGVC